MWTPMTLLLILQAAMSAALSCAFAWFGLSRWLEGRSLVIGSVACSIAFGFGKYSFAGSADVQTWAHVLALVTSVGTSVLIGKVWLSRLTRQSNG